MEYCYTLGHYQLSNPSLVHHVHSQTWQFQLASFWRNVCYLSSTWCFVLLCKRSFPMLSRWIITWLHETARQLKWRSLRGSTHWVRFQLFCLESVKSRLDGTSQRVLWAIFRSCIKGTAVVRSLYFMYWCSHAMYSAWEDASACTLKQHTAEFT